MAAAPSSDTDSAPADSSLAPELRGKDRRYLRGLGHHLQPVVLLGKHGMTDGLYAAVDAALYDHELIKIKRGQECPVDRHEAAAALGGRLGAAVVQKLGQTVLLYRPHPDKPIITLPR
ncbi:MAG: ribosome assembly RNA-binding protein YhbY [Myxococcota bacterium]